MIDPRVSEKLDGIALASIDNIDAGKMYQGTILQSSLLMDFVCQGVTPARLTAE